MLKQSPDVNTTSINAATIVTTNTNIPIPNALKPFLDKISQALSLNLGVIHIASNITARLKSSAVITLFIIDMSRDNFLLWL